MKIVVKYNNNLKRRIKNDFDKFKKGDWVLVYNLDDFIKFQKALDLVKQLE